jgi:hypothetical protein
MVRAAFRLRFVSRVATAAVLAAVFVLTAVTAAGAATYVPEKIVSDSNMRDYDSMSVLEIQAFLEAQPGPLKSLVTADYDKVITLSKTKNNVNTTPDKGEKPKTASRIIWEACRAWKISPKVMLVMLQKEQSLLTRTSLKSTTLARAIGAGCPGRLVDAAHNPVATNKFPGFGNQMWNGARLLDGYGEGKNGSTIPLFYPGISRPIYKIDGMDHIHPGDLASYKLYVYNPSIGAHKPYGDLSTQSPTGNANFWKIYNKHFGNPYANPRMRRVFRFQNRANHTYLYTVSVVERYHLAAKHRRTWTYQGVPFSVDTSVPATATVPLWRFYNKVNSTYSFTRSPSTYAARRTTKGKRTWTYQGIAYRVGAKATAGSVPVYRMLHRRTHVTYLTTSAKTVANLRKQTTTWRYEGIAYHLPRVSGP